MNNHLFLQLEDLLFEIFATTPNKATSIISSILGVLIGLKSAAMVMIGEKGSLVIDTTHIAGNMKKRNITFMIKNSIRRLTNTHQKQQRYIVLTNLSDG